MSAEPRRRGQELTAPPTGPVADFCIELGRLVRACGVPQAEIARTLGRGASSVSELLGGRRRTAPDLDDVRSIVRLCAERHAVRSVPGVGPRLDVEWWRGRHAELEHAVERTRTAPAPERLAAPFVSSPPVPAASPALDAADCLDMGVGEAVRLLADGRSELLNTADALLEPACSDGRPPFVLDALLDDFPQRVRAVHGLARSALLWAARVTLAEALIQCADHLSQMGAVDFVRLLTRKALQPQEPPATAHPHTDDTGATGDARQRDRYEHCVRLITQLSLHCPEFALTFAPRGTVVRAAADGPDGIGLAGLEALLDECAGRGTPFPAARPRLRDPIASLDSPGPLLPSLAQGYVNPRFRLAPLQRPEGFTQGVASDKWWAQQPLYDTIEHFFAAYLLGLPALLSPLLVLGHPGAGKSLLTRLLAARLPVGEFRPLRIELRHTPAEVDVQTQLEHALKRSTGRSVSWPDWSEAEPGVIPVVLLDGFDELLQAGAQHLDSRRQWGYLREVEDFQKRESELGHPLIVIVTSRTVVADRADIPRNSQVLRLEPFAEPEIERWLAIWNTTNAGYQDLHGLKPLTPETVLPHRDLAAQPLLLLMLALYDSVGNALHLLRDQGISRTQLYDRLLTEFVHRQVDKDGPLPPAEQSVAVQRELHRLSVIALGMFHRGAQSIRGEEADRDLRALGEGSADCGAGPLFGRFFFVHEAQAVVTEERLRSYEFMHATFGEHLAARLIDEALRRCVGHGPLDDGELYALLSFTPLTDRAQIVHNLRSMLIDRPGERAGTELVDALFELFRAAAWGGPGHRTEAGYAPVRKTRTYRDAVYEANLLLVAVLAAGEVYASQLLGAEGDLVAAWRRHALGWQAQMPPESWDLLCSTLSLRRDPPLDPNRPVAHTPDMLIGMEREPLAHHELRWSKPLLFYPTSHVDAVIRRAMFTGDADIELLLHTSYPLLVQFPTAADGVRPTTRTQAQTLVALLIRDPEIPLTLPDLYAMCLDQVGHPVDLEAVVHLEAVLRQLVHDAPSMPDDALVQVLSHLKWPLSRTGLVTDAMRQLVLRCIGDALKRGSPLLADVLNEFRRFFVEPEAPQDSGNVTLKDLKHVEHLSRSTHTWRWAGSLHGDAAARELDTLLADLDLPHTAATHPEALIGLLRLASELDLHDWLSAHAAEILGVLPPEAFGLLRPSDLRPLRAVLPKGAHEAEFQEVERVWRGPTPPAGTPAPRSPAV
ncbi:NACHT domain-containing protein [Streptomyces sp. NPDC051963]|uniref:NACHT domain-containing protein n=1 Tax=Streptomyces sp. NPDC051963 TaxID=3365678 RepID=UPI0037D097AF